jgi:uncharacterized membrane protein YkvA (DUF1232 family)
MDESSHLSIVSSANDSLEVEEPHEAKTPESIRARAIRYVKELGYFVRLFVSLLLDERVDRKIKLFVAAVLAYVFAPVDFIPELFSGLFGMLDDFVLSAFALNVILNWVDPEIVKSHWKGKSDLLATVQKAMKNAEILLPDAVLKKIEAWIGRRQTALEKTQS